MKRFIKDILFKKLNSKILDFYLSIDTFPLEELSLKERDNLLVLSPHPDDETLGCGGLLIKYSAISKVILLTDGRYGIPGLKPEETVKIRRDEFIKAQQILGVNKYELFNIEDGKLLYSYEVFKNIDFKNYNYIAIPNILDRHPDHRAVSILVKKALKNKLISKETKIIMYEVWSALPLPNFYIDITNIIKKKKEAINVYKSQIKVINYTEKILALNKFRGMAVGKDYAESYFIIPAKDFIKMF